MEYVAAALYRARGDGSRSAQAEHGGTVLPRGATYFLSGVMGGSGSGKSTELGIAMESQDYRGMIRRAILAADSTASIVDPLQMGSDRAAQLYPQGTPEEEMWVDDGHVRDMFRDVVAAAAAADVVVSYLPTASMGSAVELHAAHGAGRVVLCVAPGPMRGNWVVRAYSGVVFEDVPALAEFLMSSSGTS